MAAYRHCPTPILFPTEEAFRRIPPRWGAFALQGGLLVVLMARLGAVAGIVLQDLPGVSCDGARGGLHAAAAVCCCGSARQGGPS